MPAFPDHGYISKKQGSIPFFFLTFSEVEPPSAVDPMLWMPIAVLWQNTQLQVVMDKNMLDVPQESVTSEQFVFCVVVVVVVLMFVFLKSASSSDSLMKMNSANSSINIDICTTGHGSKRLDNETTESL